MKADRRWLAMLTRAHRNMLEQEEGPNKGNVKKIIAQWKREDAGLVNDLTAKRKLRMAAEATDYLRELEVDKMMEAGVIPTEAKTRAWQALVSLQ